MSVLDTIKDEFRSDKLRMRIETIDGITEKDLYPAFFEELSLTGEYSTTAVGKMLNKSGPNIRHYIKTLDFYIGAKQTSDAWKLKYKNIYKLYLAVLFVEKGYTTTDIKDIYGMNNKVIIKGNDSAIDEEAFIEKKLSQYEDILLQTQGATVESIRKLFSQNQKLLTEYMENEQEYSEAVTNLSQSNNHKDRLESKIDALKRELKLWDMRIMDEKRRIQEIENLNETKVFGFWKPFKQNIDTTQMELFISEKANLERDIQELENQLKGVKEKIGEIEKEVAGSKALLTDAMNSFKELPINNMLKGTEYLALMSGKEGESEYSEKEIAAAIEINNADITNRNDK